MRSEVRSAWPTLNREQLPDLLTQIVADPEIADQSIAARQYDSSVQGITYYGPFRGVGLQTCSTITREDRAGLETYPTTTYWACQPLYGKPPAAVFTTAFNPWLFDAHPQLAARQCFLEALTKQVLAGVKLQDVSLCDNFYTPHKLPGADYWLVAMVDELASLVTTFGTPLISGKDSSAGSTDTPEGIVSVPPAVFISALGKIADGANLLSNEWQTAGNLLVRIGPDCNSLAGTVLQRTCASAGREQQANDVDAISPSQHRQFLGALESLPHGLLRSGGTIGPGGILAEMFRGVLSSSLGVELIHQPDGYGEFFKEHRCGAIVEIVEDRLAELPLALRPQVIGRLSGEPRAIRVHGTNVLTEHAIAAWRDGYARSLR